MCIYIYFTGRVIDQFICIDVCKCVYMYAGGEHGAKEAEIRHGRNPRMDRLHVAHLHTARKNIDILARIA